MLNVDKTFFYHANGTALGGVIRWPISQNIDSMAATALPIVGGHGLSTAEPFCLEGILEFGGATGEVSGVLDDVTYVTNSDFVVERLDVRGVVTADKVVGHMISRHTIDEAEGSIVAEGSDFTNVRVAGVPLIIEVDTRLFDECDTLEKFKYAFDNDNEFKQTVTKRFLWGDFDAGTPEWICERYSWAEKGTIPESRGIVPCTIVKSASTDAEGVEIYGNIVIIPDFGKIFLGELLLMEDSRQLTMMRFELGSPVGGSLVVASVNNNGTPFP